MSDSELKSRVLILEEALRKLTAIAAFGKRRFLAEYTLHDAALHNLQVVIECLTDIGNYALRRGKCKVPETRAEVFQLLCRNGYLPIEWEDDLVEMARFRNLIVHAYAVVDLSFVYNTLKKRLGFLRSVANSLIRAVEGQTH